MNFNIENKTQKIIILLLFFLLFIITYQKYFSHTIMIVKEYYKPDTKVLDSLKIENKIITLQEDINRIDGIIGKETENFDIVKQKILSFTSRKYNEINITSLEKMNTAVNEDFHINTNVLIVEGRYNSILEFVYGVEKEFAFSKLTSVKLFKKKSYKSKKNKLYAKLIFQNYKAL